MSRRVKVVTQEKGVLEILLVWGKAEGWEPDFEPLRTLPGWADLLTILDPEVVEHALRGWSRPLTSALGISPAGAIRKIPVASRACQTRFRCAIHDPNKCRPLSPEMPVCFEPDGLESRAAAASAAIVVLAWHEGVYVVVTHAPRA